MGMRRVVTGQNAAGKAIVVSDEVLEPRKTANMDLYGLLEADDPGMHTSDTVDLEIVLAGEASLEFDDGAVVHLKAGDYLVQNGTRHRWFNRGDVPTTVAGVIIGGHSRGDIDAIRLLPSCERRLVSMSVSCTDAVRRGTRHGPRPPLG